MTLVIFLYIQKPDRGYHRDPGKSCVVKSLLYQFGRLMLVVSMGLKPLAVMILFLLIRLAVYENSEWPMVSYRQFRSRSERYWKVTSRELRSHFEIFFVNLECKIRNLYSQTGY